MKVLLSWLREFAPDIDGDPVALGETLSALGLAVEEMTVVGDVPDGVVVAEVKDLRPHPDADKIQLVDVDAGDGVVQVCCGAFNMAVGDRIAFATVGTVMGNGMEIATRKLRGQASNGMCCSAAEIGLGADANGILVLGAEGAGAELGEPLADALGISSDVLWDLEVNANRPDAMSVAGVARDLAAALGVDFGHPVHEPAETEESVFDIARVEILDPTLCGRFTARVLRNVRIGESPPWLARRLTALGMRPINNVVDISNYVMLELGQPNHTYDLALVPDGHLRVRRAYEGESIVTLDGVERSLVSSDGVIADAGDAAIGIAGVMGGSSTEISDSTTDVLLEMAWWDPPSVSRTIKRLGLTSEAGTRNRRGVDWGENIDRAHRRFASLLATSGGTLCGGQVDERGTLPDRSSIRVRPTKVNGLLGTTLSTEEIAEHLRSIGFVADRIDREADVVGSLDDVLAVTVPTWRWDTATETDVIEEVGRLHGYERIARTVPKGPDAGRLSRDQVGRRLVRETLVGAGLDETQPLPFLAPGDLTAVGLDENGIRLSNPLDANESVLRTSLLPGQLRAVAYNQSHRNDDVALFEIGHVFLPVPPGQVLPDEREYLAVAMAGAEAPAAVAILDLLDRCLALPNVQLRPGELPGLHPGRGAEVVVAGQVRGEVGEVDPATLERFEVSGRVGWLQLDLGAVLAGPRGSRRYVPVSKFPSSDIDLAFSVPDEVPAATVEATLRKAAGSLLVDLRLFDVYRGDGVEDRARSLAYRLRFQADDRTLTDGEVAEVRSACIEAVSSRTGATLRS